MASSRAAYGVTISASLAFFAVGINILDFGIVQQPAISDLHISISDSGLLVQLFFISYAIMQIPGGYLADRWGGEKTIALFSAITGVATIGLSLSNSLPMALFSRLAIGFGAGPLLPAAVRSMSSHMRGHQYELANGFFSAGWGFSQLLVLNLLPAVEAVSEWRAALLAVGVVTFGVAGCSGLIAYLVRASDTVVETPRLKKVAVTFKAKETISRQTLLLVLINVAGIVVPVTTLTWIPLRFQELFRMTPVDIDRLLSVLGVLAVISAITGGVGARILGRRLTIIVSMSATTAAVAFLASPPNLTVGLLLTGILGFASLFYASPTFAAVPEVVPAGKNNPGFVFGVYNTLSNGIAFFPPLIAALVLDSTRDYSYAFLTITAIAATGLACALLLRIERRGGNAPG